MQNTAENTPFTQSSRHSRTSGSGRAAPAAASAPRLDHGAFGWEDRQPKSLKCQADFWVPARPGTPGTRCPRRGPSACSPRSGNSPSGTPHRARRWSSWSKGTATRKPATAALLGSGTITVGSALYYVRRVLIGRGGACGILHSLPAPEVLEHRLGLQAENTAHVWRPSESCLLLSYPLLRRLSPPRWRARRGAGRRRRPDPATRFLTSSCSSTSRAARPP